MVVFFMKTEGETYSELIKHDNLFQQKHTIKNVFLVKLTLVDKIMNRLGSV